MSYRVRSVLVMGDVLAELDGVADACLSTSVWAQSDACLVDWLDRAQVVASKVAALQLTLVRELDARGVGVGQGASSTTAWLRDRYRVGAGTAARMTQLATVLDRDLPGTGAALAAGEVNADQARVIAQVVADLPADVPAQVRVDGERFLLDQAAVFGPRELGTLGQRLCERIAPEWVEERAAADLDRAEQRARARRGVWLTDLAGTSQVRLTGWLDREGAAIIRAALDPLCAPRATPLNEGPDIRTAAQRRADALVDIGRLAGSCGELPDNGGDRPQIVVTMDIDVLRTRMSPAAVGPATLGLATLDDGGLLGGATARRLACDAGIIPAVLGGSGQVLDVGRERRLIAGPLRRALVLRDRGCAFPACDRPPRWCDGHHVVHWADGGSTSLDNGVLLCGHHHRLIHHSDWQVRINPEDKRPEFIPPSYIDPQQRPQRNLYHHRE